MSTLSARHGWTLRKNDGVACSCEPTNPRHTSGAHCFTRAQVAAFRAHHPTLKTDGHARCLLFIESFAPRSA